MDTTPPLWHHVDAVVEALDADALDCGLHAALIGAVNRFTARQYARGLKWAPGAARRAGTRGLRALARGARRLRESWELRRTRGVACNCLCGAGHPGRRRICTGHPGRRRICAGVAETSRRFLLRDLPVCLTCAAALDARRAAGGTRSRV